VNKVSLTVGFKLKMELGEDAEYDSTNVSTP